MRRFCFLFIVGSNSNEENKTNLLILLTKVRLMSVKRHFNQSLLNWVLIVNGITLLETGKQLLLKPHMKNEKGGKCLSV